MTVLLTGGAGFIGLNIAERLINQGYDVVSYGLEAPPDTFMQAVDGQPGHLTVVIGDVRDRTALLNAMAQHKVTKLVHGAAVTAGLAREAQEPHMIAAVNLGGTIQALEAAQQHGIQRVVQLGTGAIFGSSVKQDGMLDEDRDIPVPDSLYGITKYAAERTGLRYRETRGLDLVVARLGTCFGRWEYDTGLRDTLSIPLHLTRLAEEGGHAIFCRELPNDWVYASDVADAVMRLLEAPTLSRPLFNLSSGQKWSAVEWCERLAAVCPGFSFEVTDDRSRANVGVSAPTPRPPFAIERLSLETGFIPSYLEAAAFSDYMTWRKSRVAVL
jgi:nucleoside-diphosphate-sugar epimerase